MKRFIEVPADWPDWSYNKQKEWFETNKLRLSTEDFIEMQGRLIEEEIQR